METSTFDEGSLREWEKWRLKILLRKILTTEERRYIDRVQLYADSGGKLRSLALKSGVLTALIQVNVMGVMSSQLYFERVSL